MRTRFLTPDYFTSPSQTLDFLRLPIPSLSAAAANTTAAVEVSASLLLSAASDNELRDLPFDDALSKFYSDVLPHTIDVPYCGSSDTVDQIREEGADLRCTKNTAQSSSHSASFDDQFSEVTKEEAGRNRIQNGTRRIVQFEIPELGQFVENACLSEKEKVLFVAEVQAPDDNLEMVNLVTVDQFGVDSKEWVNLVETIYLEKDLDQMLQIPEDVELLPKNGHPRKNVFPLLEVDEIGPVDFTRLCVEDEWHSLLVTMEEHPSTCHDDLELSCQNLLVTVKIDILEQISDCHASNLSVEFCLTSLDVNVNDDFLQLIDAPHSKSNIWAGNSVPFLETFRFEELKMLDPDPFNIFEAIAISQTVKEPEACGHLFHGNQNFKSFDDLIVSSELAITDGTFTSLPVPVLIDDEKTCSIEFILDAVLSELEELPFSTSDEIYLDWHLLGNDKCNGHVNTELEKVFSDIHDYTIKINLEPSDCGILLLDFLLSEHSLDKLTTEEGKVDMPSGGSFTEKQLVNHAAAKRLLDDDCQCIGSRVKMPKTDVAKVTSSDLCDDDEDDCHQQLRDGDPGELASSFKSMPQVNDLDFFLNPTKASVGMRNDQRLKPAVAKIMLSGGLNQKAVAAAVPSSSIHMRQLNIQLHKVMLPDNILSLIDYLQRSYLAIIRQETQLSMTEFDLPNSDDMNLLRLPEHTLRDQLSKSLKHNSCRDAHAVIFVTLCAIKRMAWCLCFYGIYNLHVFLCKLFESLTFLKPRFFSLYSLINDANSIVEKDLAKSHPSLTIIKGILRQNSIRRSKILIVAGQDFHGILKRVFSSMNISCIEVDLPSCGYHSGLSYDIFARGPKEHTQTVCALMKHEHLSPSFVMQKFDLIIECGGPSVVSKVSTLYGEHIGLQPLHFIKIELDDVSRALCEGVNVASDDTDTIQMDGLLKFSSLKGSSNIASAEPSAGGNDSLPVPGCRTAQESESNLDCNSSFQDMVIIVNTENFDKDMIISRRGTYQKILSMEKRGVQVVERDLMLPIDIIIDASTCVVWYDCKNIGKKATAEDEGSSSVPLCIENLATNVLTSLSFTFTACVLVFEGDSNFLGIVMESADELYAAAASLGINIQIFCSYSSELTEEIILNYIGQARKLFKDSLPRLPETETHVEYFFTRFPSINPLSAHAIISCGCTFLEFLKWSGDCRIHALRKYNLLEESIDLLSVMLKYGEREEAKSGLTDCSSSVSSPHDSEKFIHKVNSVDRKRKYIPDPSDAMHDFKCSIASDKCISDGLNYFESPSDSKAAKSPRISLQKKMPGFFFDEELFGDRDRPGTVVNTDPSKAWPESDVPGTVKVPKLRDALGKSTLPVKDCFGNQNLGTENEFKGQGCTMDIFKDLHEDFVGEVVDIYDKSPFGLDFQATDRAAKSSPLGHEAVEDYTPRHSKVGRKISFDSSGSYLNSPMVDDLSTSFRPEDNRVSRADNEYYDVDYNWPSDGSKAQQEPMGTGLFEKSMRNFRGGALPREKFVPPHGETPLSKAEHSAKLQQGSPWTIEFLNRIKEKRRMRQQNQPWDTSIPESSNPRNISKNTKRRSPSILEYYKYQGGSDNSTPRKLTPQRLQKQNGQLSNEKPPGLRPTWTPIDKRARRNLSFATSGAGGQTKLVWNDTM